MIESASRDSPVNRTVSMDSEELTKTTCVFSVGVESRSGKEIEKPTTKDEKDRPRTKESMRL
ncbi:hypothetical protein Bca4012_024115 [Brassica carinata]|uniref:Uncharacterized protein n=1 Tax=Brassica carinata TaxID=52824 RepID=A0A8X7NSI9_BRACI|nr:hypothetical protein Bca52824_091966 [Brassica carinata]